MRFFDSHKIIKLHTTAIRNLLVKQPIGQQPTDRPNQLNQSTDQFLECCFLYVNLSEQKRKEPNQTDDDDDDDNYGDVNNNCNQTSRNFSFTLITYFLTYKRRFKLNTVTNNKYVLIINNNDLKM